MVGFWSASHTLPCPAVKRQEGGLVRLLENLLTLLLVQSLWLLRDGSGIRTDVSTLTGVLIVSL